MVNVMKWIKRWCFLLALSLLVLPVRAQAAVYEGLDVSVWQGEIDFSQVKAAGKEMVYIRAGYGLSEDSRFRENAEGARRAGMKVGFSLSPLPIRPRPGRKRFIFRTDSGISL